MSLNLSVPNNPTDLKPRIVVFGVGGAGGNAVNNMIRSNLEGVECAVANTDAQALAQALAERRIQLGRNITQGLGAGSRPDIGRAAAEEGIDELLAELEGVHMVFIAAGMGGGTGTGASPVIARAARDHGILTVGVVTKPFHFEGPHRMRVAEEGIEELQRQVDTLIVIPNQNLFRVATEKTTFADAFKMADHVLYSGVRGVTDLMVMPGLINLDFADIRTVMSEMGKAMMGAGEANGEDRARAAAEQAINNPLLDEVSMKGARGVLINITGGPDMTLYEVDEAVNRIRDEVDPNANLIFGSTFDESLDGELRVSVFATGIDSEAVAAAPRPRAYPGQKIRLVSDQDTSAEPGYAAAAAVAAAAELAGEPPAASPTEAMSEISAAEPEVPVVADPAPAAIADDADAEGAWAGGAEADAVAPAPDAAGESEAAADGEEAGDALQELAGEPIPFDESELPPAAAELDAEEAERGLVERVSAAREELERALRDEAKGPRHEPKGVRPEDRAPRPEERAPRQEAKRPDTISPFPRVDANDRIPQSEDEDLLEIPAFLRRQAN